MSLKASELTQQIESAFEAEWAKTKTIPLPEVGGEDRRLLFAAVAHGVIEYLDTKQSELLKSITLQPTLGGDSAKYDVKDAELDVARE